VHIAPPLRGDGYISADSSCSSTRHRRAALPVNERLWIAQRFAVDWEQLNSTGHIYSGPPKDTSSYTIYGKTVYAVADATVESVIDNQPEQVPGTYPSNITLDQADGNSVILKLADRTYALYAHMQPGSIRVRAGQQVKIGDVIGLVGNTGNSVAPHLHFQVMDAPSSLGSNGLPYAIDSFVVTGSTPGTAAFDESESKGVPLAFTKAASTASTRNALPLDQLIVSFSSPK
jgi:murein DD-endopeptidase MepM/ murein hydrolase activator NlpD